MYEIIRKNWDKNKYLVISGLFAISLVLLTVVYKSDEKTTKKSALIETAIASSDLKTKHLLM